MQFLKLFAFLTVILLSFMVVGAVFEDWMAAREQQRYAGTPSDYLTLQNGIKIRVRRSGKALPSVTVVMEAGLGGTSLDWGWIQKGLEGEARIISYDRAGIGWSDAADGPVTATASAERLHDIMTQAGVGKVILVAHSLGAAPALVYQHRYPGTVAGIVLVDPVHPDQMTRLPKVDVDGDHYFFSQVRIAAQLARFGLMRFFHLWSGFAAGLGQDAEDESRAINGGRRHLMTIEREINAWDLMMDEMRQAWPPANIPMVILSSSLPDTEGTRMFQGLHVEMAKATPGATHEVVPGIDHQGLLTNPTTALYTINAIKRIIAGTMDHK